jgi:hypothetical protein
VPEGVAKLSVTFREFVGKVLADTRVLLVIDALQQLDEAERAQQRYWLPAELPPQVKVVASCISDSGKTEPVLEAFRWPKHYPVQLAALSDVYAVYHGRFAEMLLAHFDKEFSEARASAMPAAADIIKAA